MTVANFHHYKSVPALREAFGKDFLYVGRPNRTYKLAGSPLANPYVNNPRAKGVVVDNPIQAYRKWLWGEIGRGNERVLKELRRITESTVLVCWCAPSPCHADVILEAVTRLRDRTNGSE